ncbi:YhcN/YlaJ family sporulation lipoprotein [Acetivibrio cellulolyticus]|uniref:YhcN/YlaJ family sporulation lipoprotein n=1 Tax=Acetivibrio cellulolyticus TaxID=35830 RepID=UPI0001E2D099|nr:YhcN/YlaJ family sporulation lipoprotein [Acetivibrio cellulolyticus]
MNKKFLQTAAIAMGLTIFTLPLAACNTRPNYYMSPGKTGIIQKQNVTQYGTRIGNNLVNNTGRTNVVSPLPNAVISPIPGGAVVAPIPGVAVVSPVPGAPVNTSYNMTERAMSIKSQVKNVPQVKDANVIVVGDTALVACSPSNAAANTDALKKAVTQRVKSFDPTITKVVVSESPDMMTNVNQMYNNLTTKSINQITQDFNNLIKQITPSAS